MMFPFYLIRHKFVDPAHSPDPATTVGEGVIMSDGTVFTILSEPHKYAAFYSEIEKCHEEIQLYFYDLTGHHGHIAIQYVGEEVHVCKECSRIEVTPEPWVTVEGEIVRLCKDCSQGFIDGTMDYDVDDPAKTEPLSHEQKQDTKNAQAE